MGLINTMLTLIIYQVLLFFVSYDFAYISSWVIGVGIVFAFYPKYIFKQIGVRLIDKIYVTTCYIINFFLSVLFLQFLVNYGVKERLAIFAVIIFTATLNFIGMKLILNKK